MSIQQVTNPDAAIVGQVISLRLSLPASAWRGLYTNLEIWSAPNRGGPYVAITRPRWDVPRLPVTALPTRAVAPTQKAKLDGLNLKVLVDERLQVDVVFSGTDPILLSSAAAQIEQQSNGLLASYVDTEGTLVIEGMTLGRAGILRVLESSAAPVLGLPYDTADYYVYGADGSPSLTESLTYVDVHGSSTGFYKYAYVSADLQSMSDLSEPIPAIAMPILPDANLCIGSVRLVDLGGRPVANRIVEVVLLEQGMQVADATVIRSSITATTDKTGYASFILVRGSRIGVSVADTLIARELTVPTDPQVASFGLLAANVGEDDLFVVSAQTPVFMQRRTLLWETPLR